MKFSIFLPAALLIASVSAAVPVPPRLRVPGDRTELPPALGQNGRDPVPQRPPVVPAPGQPQQPPPVRLQRIADIQVTPQAFGESRQMIVRYDNLPPEALTTPVNIELVDAQFRSRLRNDLVLNRFAQRALKLSILSNITAPADTVYVIQFVDERGGRYYQSNLFRLGEPQVTALGQADEPDDPVAPLDPADEASPSSSGNLTIPSPTPTASDSPPLPSDESGAIANTPASMLYLSVILCGMMVALIHGML